MYAIKERCAVTSNDFFTKINPQEFLSHRRQASNIDIPVKTSFIKLNNSNSKKNLLKNQSPKLSVGVFRNKEINENWSLLDVNYKKVSNGLNMPIQYSRNNNNNFYYKSLNNKTKNEYNNFNITASNINTKNNKLNEFENTKEINENPNKTLNFNKTQREISMTNVNETQEIKDLKTPNIIKFNRKVKIEENPKNENNEETINENKKTKSDRNLFSKSNVKFKKLDNFGLEYFKINPKNNIENNNVKFENLINTKIQNDKKIILNYDSKKGDNFNNDNNLISHKEETKSLLASLKNHGLQYKKLIMDSHYERKNFPQLVSNQKLNNKNMMKTDVFFLKENTYNESNKINNNTNFGLNQNISSKNLNNKFQTEFIKRENIKSENYKKIERHKYVESDIFSLKNDQTSLNKIGEKYLHRENNSTINGEEYIKAKFNASSRSKSEWAPKNNVISLMNHESTNYDFFNAKIKKKFLTKANITTISNGFNPNKIQKSISEILDLTRVGVPNSNKEYVKAFENDNNIFKRKNNLCQDFSNLYKEYENICEKPFVKKLI